jgi:hypothetical protein
MEGSDLLVVARKPVKAGGAKGEMDWEERITIN